MAKQNKNTAIIQMTLRLLNHFRGEYPDSIHTISYPYIPYNGLQYWLNTMYALRHYFDIPHPHFIECGSGIGAYSYLASYLGYTVTPLELDPKLAKLAKNLFLLNTKQVDILEYNDYHKADVIYFYCPFYNGSKERDFEAKVITDMRIGAYLLAAYPVSLPQYDKRLKQYYPAGKHVTQTGETPLLIYKKIHH